jgi:hypothetical protein
MRSMARLEMPLGTRPELKMIRALKRAGGRPLYHECPGVGHNCWDLTYAMPDLYEWLLLQKLN